MNVISRNDFTPSFGQYAVKAGGGNLVISSSPSDNAKRTGRYYEVFQEALHNLDTGSLLRNFNKEALVNKNAFVTLARTQDGQTLGGLYWEIEEGQMWIRAVVVRANARGHKLGAALVATSLMHAYAQSYNLPTPMASIRVRPNGEDNVQSRKMLERIGYVANSDVYRTYLEFDHTDRHLTSAATVDHNGRHYVLSRKLIGSIGIYNRARDFLSAWSQKASA